MSDELAGIANISWVEEDALRQDVAARVAASSSREALLDEEKLKKAWKDLQDAEQRAADLQEAVTRLEKQKTGQVNGVLVIPSSTRGRGGELDGPVNGVRDEAEKAQEGGAAPKDTRHLSAEQQLSCTQFLLNTAGRELVKKQRELQRTQTDVEKRKHQRLTQARAEAAAEAQREALELRLTQQNETNNNNNVKGNANRAMQSRLQGGHDGESGQPQLRRTLPSPAAGTAVPAFKSIPRPAGRLPIPSTSANRNSTIPSGSLVAATAAAAAATTTVAAATRRVPSSFPLDARHALTMTEYSGGEVLPSLNRVQVTRADLKARHLRYEDGTDMANYLARQEKRRRLEMVEALQRFKMEQQQLKKRERGSQGNAVKSEENEGEGGNDGGQPLRPQGERHRRRPRSGLTSSASANAEDAKDPVRVKLESGKAASRARGKRNSNTHHDTPPAEKDLEKTELSPEMDDDDVIDVDALMEEEEDVSADLLREMLLKPCRSQQPEAEDKRSQTARGSQSSQSQSRRRRSSVKEESESESDEGDEEEEEEEEEELFPQYNGSRRRNDSQRKKKKNRKNRNGDDNSGNDDSDEAEMELAELERAYAALHLPPDPLVELLPGIALHTTTYEKLLDYQQEGLQWLVHLHAQRCGGILGDEMGLGKTVQIAALLNALHRSQQLRGPALIVAPMTVLRQWVAELHRWAPRLRVCVMHESSNSSSNGGTAMASRAALMESVQGTPAVVVTTYTAMRLNCVQLHSGGFQYVILDEGHKISNPEAGITLAAKSFTTPHRLILSGSPIQNRLKELWCLFDFVRPGLLGSMNRFIEEFEAPIGKSKSIRATPVALAAAVECAKALQSQIAPYLLRRLKKQVNTILPNKFERVIRVPLSDEQLELYVELVASPMVQQLISSTLYQPTIWGGGLNRDGRDSSGSLHVAGRRFNLMASNRKGMNSGVRLEAFRVMNQLRQICNHADLFRVVRGEDDDYLDHGNNSHSRGRGSSRCGRGGRGSGGGSRASGSLSSVAAATTTPAGYRSFRSNNVVNVNGGSKLRVLLEMIREWHAHGHRALIFTQTRMMLDIIENLAEQENYRYIRMDGTTAGSHRQELMDRFNEDNSIFLALLTTRVGGIGVNLVGADRVVIFDPDWNPVTDVQARERAWRIGQTRDVCVYRLITSGTVEEAILRRQLSKTYVTDKVLKDPNLQRFFHQQENLVESFFLGAEYDTRVPPGRKHVLVAQEMAALPYADDAGGEQERALEEDDGSGGVAQQQHTQSAKNNAKHELEDEFEAEAEGERRERDGAPVQVKKEEREFGRLLRVVSAEDDGFDADFTGDDARSPTSPRHGGGNDTSSTNGCETGLLKNLLDGQDVTLSGSDGPAQRLARAMATQKMQRVSAQSTRSYEEQSREFSLLAAAERQVAKEAADREEQRRYNQAAIKKELEDERARTRRRHGW